MILAKDEGYGVEYVPENGITLCRPCYGEAEAGAPGFSQEQLFRLIGTSRGKALLAAAAVSMARLESYRQQNRARVAERQT